MVPQGAEGVVMGRDNVFFFNRSRCGPPHNPDTSDARTWIGGEA